MKGEVLHEFAYSEIENEIIHISAVPNTLNGNKCKCICLSCGKQLVAKKGRIRKHHFSHKANDYKCDANLANETALHKLAKKIFEENNHIRIPPFYAKDEFGNEIKCSEECVFEYKKVDVEKKENNIIPDIKLIGVANVLIVEIAVTHKVDNLKIEKIKKRNISCIEINLAKFIANGEFDKEQLKKELIENIKVKTWIYNKKEKDLLKEYQEKFSKSNSRKNFDISMLNEKIIYCSNMEEIEKNIEGNIQVRNNNGVRYVKCETCGKIDRADNFIRYGMPKINYGLCNDCQKQLRNG